MQRIGIGKSDIGKVRTNNEDSIFVSNEKIGSLPNLYIVADGMGGHNAGEVASSLAIDFFIKFINNYKGNMTIETALLQGAKTANREVYTLSVENVTQSGMGTTFTVCVVDNERLYFAHIGDSRLYLVSKSGIAQISEDHTFVNEMFKSGELTQSQAQNHPRRNMLTRALGTEDDTEVDIGCMAISEEQSILICSDGLTNMLSDKEIFKLMNEETDNSVRISKLIETANNNGGFDNISVIII